MGKIKSALELALESTADIKVDKRALRRDEKIREGKVLAGRYIDEHNEVSLPDELEKSSGDDLVWIKEGLTEALLANITLPRYESDLNRLPRLTAALNLLASGKGKGKDTKNLEYLMNQISELFKQYLDNLGQLEDQLKERWEPRLRQKEAQLKQQTGRSVRLTPEQDPEFVKVLGDEFARMDEQYSEVVNQGKDEIRRLV